VLGLYVRMTGWLGARWARLAEAAPPHSVGARPAGLSLAPEEGQTTAEYALVILAAAAVALVLIAWAKSSGKLPAFFDKVIDDITNSFS
jgi:Flp pilus assembly pilin Flp